MKKLILLVVLAVGLIGCSEQGDLRFEIKGLKEQIKTAKECEVLRAERDKLKSELLTFQTRPEINVNVAPVSSED